MSNLNPELISLGGLDIAFKAYRKLFQTTDDFTLPELPDLTPEKLFFVSFAQVTLNVL